MMISTDLASLAPLALPLAAAATGVVSAALYGRKKQWLNAGLAGIAGVALATALADIRLPATAASAAPLAVNMEAGRISDADRVAIPAAAAIALSGDGVREAEWRDLPARPLQWKPAAADLLWLDFPRSMSLGRIFTLSVRRAPAQAGWRLQLLAENKQVLADSGVSTAAQLSVQWLPPVAEAMVLQARLLDANGKTIAQGPIPLQVNEPVPLQIVGRFDAPSFDARVLNQLLSDGSAILDWQVALGKAITRSETARAPLSAPNAMFVDAAYVEHLSPSARASLLAQTGQGVPLVILGGNAVDAGVWQRDFGLSLHPQSPTTEKEDVRQFGAALSMPPAGLNPADSVAEPWSVLARDNKKQPWIWQRNVGQGRVVWIGVADWHRHAISEPQALALWWQSAMDRIALDSAQKTVWQMSDPMPVPGLRSEVCAQGVKAGTALTAEGYAPMQLAARADKADGVCAAFWPQKAGWLKFSAEGMAGPGMEYVYAANDWPAWQRALRRDATAIYAARTSSAQVGKGAERPLPVAPFGVLFAFCMLALWYREQSAEKSPAREAQG
ncbi:hypothetical protein SAMN05216319_5417 [Duganella sp. CF402]|uniref:hypothetical protein n=1 Tax=unclassified Duganella TaxID=2636909 RepID=UPI0008BA6CED|nr:MULTISPECIES: hypothetical protein [unclassified Duganella]RZT05960.1 hypothetical protein EV582_4284 [Duganella sp. BK701]SEN15486.1 hypothetical protein SAMN05216319_5417 [Duganella sp. CF402]